MGNEEKVLALILELKDQFSATAAKIDQSMTTLERKQKAQWGSIGSAAEQAGKLMAAYFGAHAMAAFAEKVMDNCEALERQAKTTGLALSKLQELNYTATLTGTSTDALTGAYSRLAKNVQAAVDGSAEARRAFANLGVQYADGEGRARSLDDVMGQIADAMQRSTNKTEALARAQGVLGKAAGELVPLLADGSEGLAAMAREAHAMGGVLEDETIERVGELESSIKRLKEAAYGLGAELMSHLAPALTDFATAATLMLSGQTAEDLANRQVTKYGATALNRRYNPETGTLERGPQPAAPTDWAALVPDVEGPTREEMAEADVRADNYEAAQKAAAAQAAKEAAAQAKRMKFGSGTKAGAGIEADINAKLKALDDKDMTAKIERLYSVTDRLAQQHYDTRLQALQEAYTDELELVGTNEGAANQLTQEYMQGRRAILAQQYQEQTNTTSAALGSMTAVIGAFLGENNKTTKAFAIAEALYNTYAGVTMALRYQPWPMSAINAAMCLAMGMKQVAAIKAAGPDSSATGGGASIGGGGGATSSAAPTPTQQPEKLPTTEQARQQQPAELTFNIIKPIGTYDWVANELAPVIGKVIGDYRKLGQVRVNG